MLGNASVVPTLPVTDINKAKEFYVTKLGLTVVRESKMGVQMKAGNGTHLYMYERGPSNAAHTLAAFEVPDVEAAVEEMTALGIVFEHYDLPGLKTDEKGIAIVEGEGEKGAWFKDPFGNILAIAQSLK